MSLFDTNYSILIEQLLPVRLRKSRMLAWLGCCIYPIVWLQAMFKANRERTLYYLAHNSQVVYLEAALNDSFDPGAREILVVDGPYKDPLFLYQIPETRELWTGLSSEAGLTVFPTPQVLYSDVETTLLGSGFIVKVPSPLAYDVDRMRALINRYRIAGKNIYQIEAY